MKCSVKCIGWAHTTCGNDQILIWNAAVNILAVEYLVKINDEETYGKYIQALGEIIDDFEKFNWLNINLSHNMHVNNLGEMITQGDYDRQKENLIAILDEYIGEQK